MAVENYLLSREGRKLSTKIIQFMRSLIIKIETEANEEETKESYLNWINYKYAYEETDDIFAYDYTAEDCVRFGLSSETVRIKKLLNKMEAYKLQLKGDADVLNLLTKLRKERIETYVETNTYYSQFQGKPRPGQEIYVVNKDKVNESDPETLPIEIVNIDSYPLTYEYVFISGLLDKIKADNPEYYYLRFLEDKKSIYLVRNTEQFDILGCDETILNDTELNNFYKIYHSKKIYMQELMYVKGFNSRMDMYPFLMELLLLQDVFMSFFNSYMDNFALANYSDQEIFDILDSYNLSSLKNVKMTTLRKIIREIPDLMELRGSDLIIEKILDIVANNSVTIKRYYLSKVYNVSSDGQTRFDTSKTYEDNIDIVFKEKIIRKGNNSTEENTNDYLSFTEDDDTWGGDLAGLSNEQKTKAKTKFKRELMQMNFSNILTKYLTISSTVNSYAKQVKTQNLLGLLWQWLRKNQESNFMIDDTVQFNAYEIRPIDMYAAICWFNQWVNGIPEPEVIRVKNMNIAGVIALRDTGVESLINNISGNKLNEPQKISLPANLGDRSIIDILGPQSPEGENSNTDDNNWPYYVDNNGEYKINYKNTFISFKPNMTLNELFTDYDKNIGIIEALKRRWIESSTLEEAKCWDYLIQQNRTNTYFEILFDEEERFDLFIRNSNREFYNYLNITLNSDDFETVYALYVKLLEGFRDYMLTATEEKISLSTPNSDENENSVDYLSDLKLLFNEFLSVYTELHKIEFSQIIDDSPYNRIKILYHYDRDVLFNDVNEYIRYGTINKKTRKYNPYFNSFKDNHLPGYGEIVGEELNYFYVFEMMKENKLKSREDQVKNLESKMENIDEIFNYEMSKLEISNLISFIDEEIDRINYIKNNSIGGLTADLANKLELCSLIKANITRENVTKYFYKDVLNITVGNISGRVILLDFIYSEIVNIRTSIEEVKERTDILPHYKHYIQSELFEAYSDKIIEVKKILSLNLSFDPSKMIYHHIDMISEDDFRDKVRIEIETFEDLVMTEFKDKISIPKHSFFDHDLSFTLFFDDYIKVLNYVKQAEEFDNEFSQNVIRLEEKLLDDYTTFIKRDSLRLKDNIEELVV